MVMTTALYRRLRVPVFWISIAVVYMLAITPLSIDASFGAGDKINHILAFIALTILGRGAYPEQPRWKLAVGLALFGAVIEVTQGIPLLRRDPDIADWIADNAAVGFGLLLSLPLERRRTAQASR